MKRGLRVLASISLVGLSGLPALMPEVHAQDQTAIITGTRDRPPPNCNNTGTCVETGSGYSSGGNGGGGGGYIPEGEGQNTETQAAATKADVCKNPLATASTRATSSTQNQSERHVAASQLFKAMRVGRALSDVTRPYQAVVNGVATLMDAFEITYSDGASELWLVKPGQAMTGDPLVDLPPAAMTPPTKPAGSSCQAA
jgi:hypothetical protein